MIDQAVAVLEVMRRKDYFPKVTTTVEFNLQIGLNLYLLKLAMQATTIEFGRKGQARQATELVVIISRQRGLIQCSMLVLVKHQASQKVE